MAWGVAGSPGPHLQRSLAWIVAGVIGMVPMLAYPGNWTDSFSPADAASSAWPAEAALVYVGLAGSLTLVPLGLWGLLRAVDPVEGTASPPWWTQALSRVLLARRSRAVLLSSAAGYLLFFGIFSGVLGVAPSGDINAAGAPSLTESLCCGPVGLTPGLVVVVNAYLQVSLTPEVLLLGAAGTALFALNVTATTELLRQRHRAPSRSVAGVAGAFGAFLANCPTCGTIILVNALEGTGAAGFLVGWTVFQAPLLLLAFPLGILSLHFVARGLLPMTCERVAALAHPAPSSPSPDR